MDCGGKRSATPLWLYLTQLSDRLLFIEEKRRRASLAAAVQLFMTPIVVKEIRLLLPAYVMALLLAILPIWLLARLLAGTTVYDPSSGTWTNAGADAAT